MTQTNFHPPLSSFAIHLNKKKDRHQVAWAVYSAEGEIQHSTVRMSEEEARIAAVDAAGYDWATLLSLDLYCSKVIIHQCKEKRN